MNKSVILHHNWEGSTNTNTCWFVACCDLWVSYNLSHAGLLLQVPRQEREVRKVSPLFWMQASASKTQAPAVKKQRRANTLPRKRKNYAKGVVAARSTKQLKRLKQVKRRRLSGSSDGYSGSESEYVPSDEDVEVKEEDDISQGDAGISNDSADSAWVSDDDEAEFDDVDEDLYAQRLARYEQQQRERQKLIQQRQQRLQAGLEEEAVAQDDSVRAGVALPVDDLHEDVVFDGGFKVPGSIYGRLFDYQRTGLKWLWELHGQRAGGIIGDEMGLGKTIQVRGVVMRWDWEIQSKWQLQGGVVHWLCCQERLWSCSTVVCG